MASFLSPGVFVREVENDGRAIIGVGTSTSAFLGLAERGPIGEPQLITSFEQYTRVFGGFTDYSYLTFAVWGFFLNGGTACWVVRTADYDDTTTGQLNTTANQKASLYLKDRSAGAGVNTILAEALNEGEWGDDLKVSIGLASNQIGSFNRVLGNDGGVFTANSAPARTPGLLAAFTEESSVFTDRTAVLRTPGGGAAFAIPANVGDAMYFGSKEKTFEKLYFDLDVAGIAGAGRWEYYNGTSWVEFTPATDNTTEFTAVAADNLLIEWSAPGDWTQLEVNSVSGYYVRFLITTLYTTPAQISRTTIGEDRPFGPFTVVSDASLETAAATALDDAMYIGATEKFNFVEIYLAQAGDATGQLQWEYWNGSIWTPVSNLTETITDAQHMQASGIIGFDMPTDWAKNSVNTETFYWLRARITTNYASDYPTAEHVLPQSKYFSMLVSYAGNVVEIYDNLTMDTSDARYVETIVGTTDDPKSEYITVADQNSGSTAPNDRPRAIILTALSGGAYDVTGVGDQDYIGTSAGQTGLYAFDAIDDVNILCVPGINTEAVLQAMLNYCESRADLIAILDSTGDNKSERPQDLLDFIRDEAALNSTYGAIYDYWIIVSHPQTGARTAVPPSGFAAGAYARTDFKRGVWKSPAGINDGKLFGALGVVYNTSRGERDALYPARINPIVDEAGIGIYIDGGRTLGQLSSSWSSIPIRRLFLFAEESIQEGIKFAKHEPNGPATWRAIRASINAFLKLLWQDGGLFGEQPADAFFVIVDESNNPPTLRRTGRLVVRVGMAPLYPAEFIDLTFEVDQRAINEELAAAGLL